MSVNQKKLSEGEENILVDGMEGKVVDSVLKIKYENGDGKIKELGVSTYNPMINLIERNELVGQNLDK